jgi:hypothetical protein
VTERKHIKLTTSLASNFDNGSISLIALGYGGQFICVLVINIDLQSVGRFKVEVNLTKCDDQVIDLPLYETLISKTHNALMALSFINEIVR